MSVCSQRLLAIGIAAFFVMGCSASSEQNSDEEAQSFELPMKFNWDVPARLGVVESLRIQDTEIKIRYDVTLESYGSYNEQLLLTTNNVTPVEVNGEQVNTSTLPAAARQSIKKDLIDYHARPRLIVSAQGEVVRVEGLETSIRTMAEINGIEQKEKFVEFTLNNPFVLNRIKAIVTSVWDCWLSSWTGFEIPVDETLEQSISIVILDGAPPVPAARTLTNHGYTDASRSVIHLETKTVAEGTELAQAMMELSASITNQMNGETGEADVAPDIEGVAKAKTVVNHQVKIDPATMMPVWAQCSREFSVESEDAEIMPPRNEKKETEYHIQWFK